LRAPNLRPPAGCQPPLSGCRVAIHEFGLLRKMPKKSVPSPKLPVYSHPMRRRLLLAASLCLLPLMLHAQREKLPPEDLAWVEETFPKAKKTNTGIRYDVLAAGSGEKAKPGDMVSVLYVGRLLNGETFDQTSDREKPFRFRLGRGHVIQGWDQILQLMRPGDKWVVIIPSELAYGSRGTARIPRDSTLVFMIELLDVKTE
jgi:hypothetical protein